MANKKDKIIEGQKASSKEVKPEEPKASQEKPSQVIYSLSGIQTKNQKKAIHSL